MKSDWRFHQENKILQTVESSLSTNVSMIKPTIFVQGLFLQHLHEGVNMVLSLQPSLLVSRRDDILRHLYLGISTVVPLQHLRHLYRGVSMVVFLQLFLLVFLRSEFLQPSLLKSQWNIFLRLLYVGISTVISIPPKPVIFL